MDENQIPPHLIDERYPIFHAAVASWYAATSLEDRTAWRTPTQGSGEIWCDAYVAWLASVDEAGTDVGSPPRPFWL